MQLLFATHLHEWGGGEQWMLTAALAMAERGHSVTLAVPDNSVIARRARDKNLDVLPCGFVRDIDPVSWWTIFRFCVTRRVDVLCLNMDRVLRVAGGAARLAGVRAILPRRGSEFPLKSHLNYRWQYGFVSSGMIVNSKATRDTLCRDISWRPRGTIHLLYNGLDLAPHANTRARVDTRADLDITDDALLLINVGELTSRKNAALLIRSLPAIIELRADTHVILVGSGTEAKALHALAHDCGVTEHVHLLGFREDVADLLAASDLLVHCAHLEGFGFAVAEAGAAGIPAIGARTSSVPEIIVEGETGALFEDDSVADLVRAIGPYLQDQELRRRHGVAGRARVEEHFELSKQMSELEVIFESECGKGTRS